MEAPPEEDQASTTSIDDRLVVDERAAPLDEAAQQGEVLRLPYLDVDARS